MDKEKLNATADRMLKTSERMKNLDCFGFDVNIKDSSNWIENIDKVLDVVDGLLDIVEEYKTMSKTV